jgi:N-acetylgalactosamine-N,N'-diacetylbacillosaminyl-diphospho-undecaprenol 4-alpha-N-acetylgalactosaminyltransferase
MGGTEKNAVVIGKELLDRGFDIRFVIFKEIYELADERILKQVLVISDGGFRNKVVRLFLIWFNLIVLLIKNRPSSLISFSTTSNILAFCTFYHNIIFTIDTNIFFFKRKLYRRYLQKYLSVFPNIRKVIVPSEGLKDNVVKYFISKKKVVRLYNPVDFAAVKELAPLAIQEFDFLKEGKFIVTAGRLSMGKRVDQLITFFARSPLSAEYHLVILGRGKMEDPLRKLIESLNMNSRIHMLGFQQNPYRFFSKARYFVLNSEFESFANVLIEALACGTPVISNDCDFGPREIIHHGVNGLLYKREHESDFLNTLSLLVDDEALYTRMKARTIDSVNRFNKQIIVDQWLKVI